MEFTIKDSTVEFGGYLDERSSLDVMLKGLQQAAAGAQGSKIRVDFSKVKKANSVGILSWAKVIDLAKMPLVYVAAPEWLVEQFNLSDLLRYGSIVESVQAPFYCPDTDTREMVTLVIGKDVPVQKEYQSLQLQKQSPSGALLEADFEPYEYFHFISRDLQKFLGGVK
jgi:hypothetical protein